MNDTGCSPEMDEARLRGEVGFIDCLIARVGMDAGEEPNHVFLFGQLTVAEEQQG